MMLLCDAEDLLHLWSLPRVRVINLIRIELFHFLPRDEASLMTEPLLRQILTAIIAHPLFVASLLLLPPVLSYFCEYIGAFELRLWVVGVGTTLFLVYNFARGSLSIEIIVRRHFIGYVDALQRLVEPACCKFIELMGVILIRLGSTVIIAQRVVHDDVTL